MSASNIGNNQTPQGTAPSGSSNTTPLTGTPSGPVWNAEDVYTLVLTMCNFKDDSLPAQALEKHGVSDIEAWMDLEDSHIEDLTAGKKNDKIPVGHRNLIRLMRDFARSLYSEDPYFNHSSWANITRDDFSKYRISKFSPKAGPSIPNPNTQGNVSPNQTTVTAPLPSQQQQPTATQATVAPPVSQTRNQRPLPTPTNLSTTSFLTSPTTGGSKGSTKRDTVSEFAKTTKRDKNNYVEFKDEKLWDRFHRSLVIQAHADGIQNQLDRNYQPSTAEEQERDDMEGKFFYSVLDRVLLTDYGKTVVRKHLTSFDARAAYAEMVDYMTKSTKAHFTRKDLLTYITTAQLGVNTPNVTAEHFILYWKEKLRILDSISDDADKISTSLRLILLQNAVSQIDDLRKVQNNSDILAVQTGKALTYDQYYTLLEAAAITYDKSMSKAKRNSRLANEHAFMIGEDNSQQESSVVNPSHGFNEGEIYGGIDLTINDFLTVNKTTQFPVKKASFPPTNGQPKQRPNHNPYLPSDLFTRVRDNWSRFDDKTKQLLMSPKPPSSARPNHNINNHDIQYDTEEGTLEPSIVSDDEQGSEPSPLMDAITGQAPMEEADIRNVLSAHKARQARQRTKRTPKQATTLNEVTIDGKVYREITMAERIVYRVSESKTLDKRGSLIDRGANGGMVGNDVRVIDKTGRHVDVKGIDSHTVNGLEIVTAAGLVATNKGPRIVIMHQYAYLGHGKTIHSAGQIEWFKHDISDKSVKVGGQQRLLTLDGTVIPFTVRSGLAYMDSRPPTDHEMLTLPHIILTSDETWDPTVLDFEHDSTEDYASAFPAHNNVFDKNFDESGEYLHGHTVANHAIKPSKPSSSKIAELKEAKTKHFETFNAVMERLKAIDKRLEALQGDPDCHQPATKVWKYMTNPTNSTEPDEPVKILTGMVRPS